MFGLFRKKKSAEEIVSTTHADIHELFSALGIVQNLAMLHKIALEGNASNEECNDLVMGAYRTLYLAAGIARNRVQKELANPVTADEAANSILNESGLQNIVQMIRESVPRNEFEPALAVSKEMGELFQAAAIFDDLVKQRQFEQAHEVWRICAKGSYGALRGQ